MEVRFGAVTIARPKKCKTRDMPETIALNLRLGARTNASIRCGGVSLNTAHLGEDESLHLLASESERLGRAVADPMRGGAAFERLVAACLA